MLCMVNIAIWLWGMESFFRHDFKNLKLLKLGYTEKMLRISWKDRVTNDEVYRHMGTGKVLLGDIVRRQLSFVGHVLRKEVLEQLVVTVFVDGKRARGRQRETFLTYLGKMKNKLPMELLQMAKNRTVWSKLCT